MSIVGAGAVDTSFLLKAAQCDVPPRGVERASGTYTSHYEIVATSKGLWDPSTPGG